MLRNGLLYRDEVNAAMLATWYDERYQWYYCGQTHQTFNPPDSSDENGMSFASLDSDGNLIGLIWYQVERDIRSVGGFSIINFTDGHRVTFAKDLRRAIDDIFVRFGMHRLEFSVVIGNPAEAAYDRMIERIGGRVIGTYRDRVTDMAGKLHDFKVYEVLEDEYLEYRRMTSATSSPGTG